MPRPPEPESPPPAPQPEAEPAFDWERWLGVRGAAVGGGFLLALAGLYLFQYSIERGWISPLVRLLIGTAAGLLALVGSHRLRARSYQAASAALAGGGFAILYAVVWAAHRLYGLLGAWPAFGLMALVTAGCCLLAARYGSLVVAALGLLGGFAAPLAIAGALTTPTTLFVYLLLLDAGLLVLAARQRWPWLGALALGATALHQLGFLFAAPSREIDVPLPLLTATLVLLSAGASWVSAAWRRRGEPADGLATASATTTVATFGAWVVSHGAELPSSLGVVLATFALAAVPALFHLRDAQRDPPPSFAPLTVTWMGLAGVLVLASTFSSQAGSPWGWLLGSLGLLVALGAAGWRWRQPAASLAAPLLIASAFLAPFLVHLSDPKFPSAALWLGLALGLTAALAGLAHRLDSQADGETGETPRLWGPGLATLALLLLGVAPAVQGSALGVGAFVGLSLAAAALTLLVALAIPAGALAFAGTLAASLVLGLASLVSGSQVPPWHAQLLALGGALLLICLPVLLGTRLGSSKLAQAGALVLGPAWLPALQDLWEPVTGPGFEGGLAALFAVAYGLAFLAAKRWPGAPARPGLALAAIGFVTVALPLQLDGTALTLAWAVEALALLALGVAQRSKRLRQLGLAVLVGALLKLFLYDLAALQDLARVASLVGLAVSLLLVSVGYQRWLSRLTEPPEAEPPPAPPDAPTG